MNCGEQQAANKRLCDGGKRAATLFPRGGKKKTQDNNNNKVWWAAFHVHGPSQVGEENSPYVFPSFCVIFPPTNTTVGSSIFFF